MSEYSYLLLKNAVAKFELNLGKRIVLLAYLQSPTVSSTLIGKLVISPRKPRWNQRTSWLSNIEQPDSNAAIPKVAINFTINPYKRENTQNSSNIFTTDKSSQMNFSFPHPENFRHNDSHFLR